MCGISGIFSPTDRERISIDSLSQMTEIIKYRGPEETGIYMDDQIGLGHVRLSIIDLEGGTQPIHNENQTLWIVYNGEVFNYQELKDDLIKKGHTFYTNTDTEVIVHLFEEKREDCFNDLNGQFVFAIWDSIRKELIIGRDRFGIRPLFYCWEKDTLFFSSEIKAIFAVSDISRELNPYALDQIFTLWTTLPGYSTFSDISEMRPGHYLKITDNQVVEKKYWSIPYCGRDQQLSKSPSQISEEILELLTDAVKIRLRADVPVGTYLSGGLDSSGITSLVANKFNHNVHTFGLVFEETDFDESTFQKEMVSYLQVNHTEVTAKNDHIAQNFAKVLWHCEKPLLRTAPVPLYLLSQQVRDQGFKVVLTGEGADEVFGGYNIFREALVRNFWARQPHSSARAALIEHLYPNIFKNPLMKKTMLRFFGRDLDKNNHPLFSHLIRWENTRRTQSFFSDELLEKRGEYNCFDELTKNLPADFNTRDCLSKAQYLEQTIFLSNYLLSSQGDRVAMANSIEIRLPFLDYRLVDYMAGVPSIWKILGLKEKYILKRCFQNILPSNILQRNKHPFRAPIQQCLYNEKVSGIFQEFLSQSALKESGLFNPDKVARFKKKLASGRSVSETDGMALAGIISSQIIHSQFVSRFKKSGVPTRKPDLLIDKRTGSVKTQPVTYKMNSM